MLTEHHLPLQPANTITSDGGPYSYGSRGSNYTYKVKYNRTNTNTNYPALVWIEYHSGNGGLLDTRTTYGLMIANNWQEKENMKATLANWVRGQMIASAPQDTGDMERGIGGIGELWTRLALSKTGSKVFDILPLSTAQAAPTNPSIVISATRTSLSRILTSGIWTVNFLGNTGSPVVTYSKPITGRPNIGGKDKDALLLKELMNTIQTNAEQIKMINASCTGVGSTLPVGSINGCVLTTVQYNRVKTLEDAIFTAIGTYLNFGVGLTKGAGVAIYEEIMGIGHDVSNLADGTTLREFETQLSSLKQTLSKYIINGQIDYASIQTQLITGASAIEQEISTLISGLPGALGKLDAYNKGYYSGMIGGGAILEMINPEKKLKLITRGFSAGRWVSIARYIVDASKAGHSGTKIAQIAEKMRYVNWSRVDKPDMGKVTNLKLKSLLDEWYRPSATIGNGSTADIIRYEKTTGILMSPSGHIQKGEIIRNTLVKNNGLYESLNVEEKKIAEAIYADISDAINGN